MHNDKIDNRASVAIKTIQDSNRSPAEKDILTEMVADARAAATCDGSEDDQLGKLAVAISNMTFILVSHLTDSESRRTWKDVIIQCRHEIVLALGLLAILLALRPQIATALEAIFR